jgi:hypothetical protein
MTSSPSNKNKKATVTPVASARGENKTTTGWSAPWPLIKSTVFTGEQAHSAKVCKLRRWHQNL